MLFEVRLSLALTFLKLTKTRYVMSDKTVNRWSVSIICFSILLYSDSYIYYNQPKTATRKILHLICNFELLVSLLCLKNPTKQKRTEADPGFCKRGWVNTNRPRNKTFNWIYLMASPKRWNRGTKDWNLRTIKWHQYLQIVYPHWQYTFSPITRKQSSD